MHLSEFDLFRNTWPFLTSSIASDLWKIFRLTTFSQRRGLRRAWRDHSQPYLRGLLRWISRYIFQQELLMHCLQGHCLHAHSLTDWRSWHRDYSFIKLWNGNNQNLTRFCSVSIDLLWELLVFSLFLLGLIRLLCIIFIWRYFIWRLKNGRISWRWSYAWWTRKIKWWIR